MFPRPLHCGNSQEWTPASKRPDLENLSLLFCYLILVCLPFDLLKTYLVLSRLPMVLTR